jgi:hypothetical protein
VTKQISPRIAIQMAKWFLPLSAFEYVESVLKIETGFECSQWLPKTQRNTVLMQHHDKRRAASEIVIDD